MEDWIILVAECSINLKRCIVKYIGEIRSINVGMSSKIAGSMNLEFKACLKKILLQKTATP